MDEIQPDEVAHRLAALEEAVQRRAPGRSGNCIDRRCQCRSSHAMRRPGVVLLGRHACRSERPGSRSRETDFDASTRVSASLAGRPRRGLREEGLSLGTRSSAHQAKAPWPLSHLAKPRRDAGAARTPSGARLVMSVHSATWEPALPGSCRATVGRGWGRTPQPRGAEPRLRRSGVRRRGGSAACG